MKKHITLTLLLILGVLLTACSNDKADDEIFESIADNTDDVKNYELEIDLQVVITDEETEDVLQSSQALMEADHFEKTEASAGTLKSVNDEMEEIIEYYILDGSAYANIDDQGWENVTESDFISEDDTTTYDAISTLITDIEDEVDVATDGDSYVLTFEGKSQSIYDAFEEPYSLTLSGVSPADVEHDVEIRIDQDTMYVQQVKNTITGTNDGLKLELSIDHKYSNVNNVDEIEIPQEVLDEAK